MVTAVATTALIWAKSKPVTRGVERAVPARAERAITVFFMMKIKKVDVLVSVGGVLQRGKKERLRKTGLYKTGENVLLTSYNVQRRAGFI